MRKISKSIAWKALTHIFERKREREKRESRGKDGGLCLFCQDRAQGIEGTINKLISKFLESS